MEEFFINLSKDYDERFTPGKFMEFLTDNYDPLTSHVLNSIKDLKPKGKVTVQGTDFRPDVLSFQIYSDTQYWWVLMIYNSFLTIDDIINGEEVKYPDIGDLEDLYYDLKIKQGNNA